MVTSAVQTTEDFGVEPKLKIETEEFKLRQFLPGPRVMTSAPRKTYETIRSAHDFSRLEATISEKREEIKSLRAQLRTREEAFARQNAEIGILKRQLRDQERDMNRTRRAAQT